MRADAAASHSYALAAATMGRVGRPSPWKNASQRGKLRERGVAGLLFFFFFSFCREGRHVCMMRAPSF